MISTINEARTRLSEMAAHLNPEVYGRLKAEVDEVSKAARAHAERFYTPQFDNLDTVRHDLLVEACEVRDSFEGLRAEAELDRLSAGEYGERFNRLTARRDRVEQQLAEVERRLDVLGAVEDDPEAWADSQYRRYPTTRPTFSF